MKFSDRLKKLRNQKGITQSQLADAIYVSRSTIAKYERGIVYPTKENIEKIALYFNVKIKDLIDVDEGIQLSLENARFIENVHKIICWALIGICVCFIVISFVPILNGWTYEYPILPGADQPQKKYYTWSLIQSTLKNNNPIVIITIISCLINIILCSTQKFVKSKKISYIIFLVSVLTGIVNIFLIIISIIYGCAYVH